MRLEEFHLEGFGHFHQHTVGPLDRNVTVLYGPNEAGKSTLLAFVRAVLFGFPQRGRNQYYPPLAGGRHGGRIRLVDDNGARYTLERFTGTQGGPFDLRAELDGQLQDTAFLHKLTGHASADLFKNVFAFSLDEIQSEGLMSNSEVAGRIYSAGMGASRLPDFAQSLAKRKETLYRPRGSAQQIAEILRELETTDQQLREIRSYADLYLRLTNRQDEIAKELDQATAEISALNHLRTKVDRLIEGWNDWEALQTCEERLKEMPRFERLPETPIERLENLEDRIQQAREDRDEAQEQLRKTAVAANAEIDDESLQDDVDQIEAILRARSSFDNSVRDLPERQDELHVMEEALAEKMRQLGDGWDEDSLDRIDTSPSARSEVEQWKEQHTTALSAVKDTGIRWEQETEQLAELQEEITEAQRRLLPDTDGMRLAPPSGSLAELLNEKDQLEQIRRGRNGFADSVGDLPERRAELKERESGLNASLRDLGQDRDEPWLDSFDASVVFRQEVDRWKERLGENRDAVRQAQLHQESEESRLSELHAAVQAAAAKMPATEPELDAAAIEEQWRALRRSRSRLQDFERDHVNRDNLQLQLQSLPEDLKATESETERPSRGLPIVMGLLGIVLMLIGVFLGQPALALGIAGGLTLMLTALYLLRRNRTAPANPANLMAKALANNLKAAQEKVDASKDSLAQASAALGLEGVPTTDALDNAEAGLRTKAAEFTAWTEAQERLTEANEALQFQEKRVELARQESEAAADSARGSRQEWLAWLEGLGMDGSFTPETVAEFAGQVETARARLDQVRGMRQRVRAIEVDIQQYQDLVRPLAVKYGVDLYVASPSHVMAVADNFMAQFDFIGSLVRQQDDVARRLKRQEQHVEVALQKRHAAGESLDEWQTRWKGWLLQRSLNDSFNPDGTIEFLARVEAARASRNEVRGMRARVAAIEHDIEEFRQQVTPLAQKHGNSFDASDTSNLAAAAEELIGRLNVVHAKLAEREQAIRQKELEQGHLNQRRRRLQNVKDELAHLLKAGGTDDAEEFRRRVRQQSERREMERQRDDLQQSLRRLSNAFDHFEAFKSKLTTSTREGVEQESQEIAVKHTKLENHCNLLREERGGNDNAMAQLTSEEESSSLRMRRYMLVEQLQESAREWSRLSIAETLLDRTRRKFEQERQPSVIQHAKDIFCHITGQRYRGLYAPIGEQTITVTDAQGGSKLPAELSRGTREQLYLSLRFGLILEFGEHAERLPVVVDEALVNFDPERARLASEAFTRLAETNQVLVFTCHRTMADMFVENGARVLDISSNSR